MDPRKGCVLTGFSKGPRRERRRRRLSPRSDTVGSAGNRAAEAGTAQHSTRDPLPGAVPTSSADAGAVLRSEPWRSVFADGSQGSAGQQAALSAPGMSSPPRLGLLHHSRP